MVIGFDYFHTITDFPELMAGLAGMFRRQGDTVVIVSGIANTHDTEKYRMKIMQECSEIYHFSYDDLVIVTFSVPTEVPGLKLAVAKSRGIDLFLDDRKDVVDHLNAFGVNAIWVKRSLTRLPK